MRVTGLMGVWNSSKVIEPETSSNLPLAIVSATLVASSTPAALIPSSRMLVAS